MATLGRVHRPPVTRRPEEEAADAAAADGGAVAVAAAVAEEGGGVAAATATATPMDPDNSDGNHPFEREAPRQTLPRMEEVPLTTRGTRDLFLRTYWLPAGAGAVPGGGGGAAAAAVATMMWAAMHESSALTAAIILRERTARQK